MELQEKLGYLRSVADSVPPVFGSAPCTNVGGTGISGNLHLMLEKWG